MVLRLSGPWALTAMIILSALPARALALGEAPQSFTLDGKLFSDAAGTQPLSDTGSLLIQILDPAQSCVLYEESQSFDVTQSDGFFHATVGSALGAPKRNGTSGLDSNNAMALVYANANSTGIPGKSLGGGGCTYVPASGDARYLRVTVLTNRDHASRTLTPNMTIDSTPFAIVAERAETLRGLTPANFLQLETPGHPNLTQANLESLLNNFSSLQNLAAGTSSSYMTSGTGGAAALPQPSTPPSNAASTEGQIWYDPSSHQVRFSDGSSIQSVGAAGSGITTLSVGQGLTSTSGTTISTGGQTINVNAGTAASQIVQLDGSARLPAVDGSQLTALNASNLLSGTVSVGVNTTAGIQTSTYLQAAEARLTSLKIFAGANYVEQRAPAALTGNYSLTWPVALPGSGTTQVLTADATGQLNWVDLNAGLVSNQATLGPGQIWIGDAGGKAQARTPSGDVSLSQAGAFKVTAIQSVGVSSTAPGASGQVLRYDGVANQYVPTFVAMTDLRSKTTGTSSFGTSCSASQTLTYDAVSDTMSCQNISVGAGQLQNGVVSTAALANDAVTAAKINSTGIAVNRLLITDATTGTTVTYAACAMDEVLKFGPTGWVCTSVAALSPVTSVAGKFGAVVLNANDVNGLGTAALLDAGTAASQVVRLDSAARLPALDASLLVNVNAVQIQSRAIASAAPTADQVLTWNATGVQWEPRAIPAAPVQSVAGRAGNVVLFADDLVSDVGHYFSYRPNNVACNNGEILKWDGTRWSCGPDNDSGGDVTSVTAGVGLTGGGLSGALTINVDVGTAANKILQLNASAQVPAVDGSLLTSVNAVKLQSAAVSSVAPTGNQILKFNATTLNWEPGTDEDNGITALSGDVVATGPGPTTAVISHNAITSVKINDVGVAVNRLLITDATTGATIKYADQCAVGEILKWTTTGWSCAADSGSTGFVSAVATGVGLLGGTITSTGTLSIDVGTAANKILQLNASAQIPAVDGSLLTSVNAVKLQNRPVASTLPTAGQSLNFNAASAQWEPFTPTLGTVTSIATGIGILGGPISSTGTLNVDVGTAANKILQLNASAQIPAVDGSLLTSVNAVKLQSRAVASTAPTAGQTLAFNAVSTQWEPYSPTTGTVTSIATGTGLLGGPITSAGTLNIDVGTAANKIPQLNSNSQLALGNGSLGAPTYAFNDPTSGIYAPADGQMALVTTGIARLNVTAGGNIGIGTTSSANPLTISSNAPTPIVLLQRTTGNNSNIQYQNPSNLFFAGLAPSGNFGVGVNNNLDTSPYLVITQAGNVAIGSNIAGAALDIAVKGSSSAILIPRDTTGNRPAGVSGMIRYNTTSNAFEAYGTSSWLNLAMGPGVGTVQSIASGTGLLGGPITSNGTFSVDVGTAANKILQLNGNAQVAPALGTAALPSYAFTGNASTGLYSPGTNQLALAVNGSPAVTIGSGGNVGIGTSAPQGPLSFGRQNFSSLATYSYTNTTDQAVVQFYKSSGDGQSRFLDIVAESDPSSVSTGSSVRFLTQVIGNGNVSESMRIAANGFVGVGSATPLAALDVSSVGSAGSAILVPRDSTTNRPVGVNGMIRYNTTSTAMETFVNGAWANFAVGTGVGTVQSIASGTGLLGGPITSSGTLSVDVGTAANKIVQQNASAQIAQSAGSVTAPAYTFAGNTATGLFSPGTNQIGFANNGTTSMAILANGFVGVGTATPQYPLDVSGVAFVGGPVNNLDQNQTGHADLTKLAFSGKMLFGYNYSGGAGETDFISNRQYGSSGGFQFFDYSNANVMTPLMNLRGDGRLAIGTLTPQAALDVTAVGSASAIIVPRDTTTNRPAGVNGMIRYNTTSTAMETFVNGAWANFAVGSGVGTVQSIASGTGLLGGPITSNGTLSVDVGTAANKILQLNASAQLALGNGSVALPSHTFADATTGMYSAGAGQLGLATSGTARFNILANGNVGIGTTAPVAQLNLQSASYVSPQMLLQNGLTAAPPAIPSSFTPALTVATSEVSGSRPLFFGYVNGSSWDSYLTAGACASFGSMCFDMGQGSTTYTALKNSGSTLQIGGGGGSDGSFAAVSFGNTGSVSMGSNSTTSPLIVTGAGGTGLGNPAISATVASNNTYQTGVSALDPNLTAGNSLLSAIGLDGSNAYNAAYTGFLYQGSGSTNNTLTFGFNGANNLMALQGNGKVGIGTATPAAALDVAVIGSASAIIVPRDTTANRPTGVNGMIRYNTTSNGLEGFVGGAWSALSAGTSAGTVTNLASGTGLIGGPITTTGTLSVDVGTAAIKIPQLNATAQLALSNGTALAPSHSFADTATGMYSPGTGQLSLATSGTARLSILTNGNVGIGTTAPTAALQVLGSTNLYNLFTVGQYNASVNYNGSNVFSVTGNPTGGNNYVMQVTGGAPTTSAFLIKYTNNNGLVGSLDLVGNMYAAGTVGVGTNVPLAALDVTATGSTSAIVIPRDIAGNRPAGVNGMLRYNTTSNAFEGYQAGAWTNLVNGSGGVTSLASGTGLLGGPVTSTGTLSVDVGTAANKIPQLNASSQLALGNGTAGLPSHAFADATTGMYSPGAGQLSLATSGTARLSILANGNVGIGTTAPAYPFHVNATSMLIGLNGTAPGAFVQNTNYFGIYDSGNSLVYGISRTLPSPGGTSTLGGYYSGLGIGGSTNNLNRPMFGILSSGQSGNGIGATAFTIYDNNKIVTYHGVLNDGAGNMAIGSTTAAAALDVTGTGAMSSIIVPRDTTANRPTGLNGMLRYNTTTGAFEGYAGSQWQTIAASATTGYLPLAGGTMTGALAIAAGTAAAPGLSLANDATTGLYSTGAATILLATAGTARLAATNTGVGFGNASPQYPVDVTGDINSSTRLRVGGTQVCTSAGCTTSSDIRLKENVRPLETSLDKVLKLDGVSWTWIDQRKYGAGQQIGFIAQDLEKVFPEVVETDPVNGLKSVRYGNLIAPVIEALKQMYAKLTGHDERLKRLEAENSELKAKVLRDAEVLKALDARLRALETRAH